MPNFIKCFKAFLNRNISKIEISRKISTYSQKSYIVYIESFAYLIENQSFLKRNR